MIDLIKAQKYMKDNNIDAWILYDFKGVNNVLHSILNCVPAVSRRYFLIIENIKKPILICNILDKPQFEFCEYEKHYYSKLEDMTTYLRNFLKSYRTVITEYSPFAELPTMSILDAGTYELIQNLNKNMKIMSSADCYQLSCGSWEERSLKRHLDACVQVEEIKNMAFAFIKENLLKGHTVSEYDVQQMILEMFEKRGLITEDVPVVAVNQNSNNPHYEPSSNVNTNIGLGDWVLIDLWAKYPENYAVFADITWVGYMGENVPEQYTKIFNIVKEMRDAVVQLLKKSWSDGIVLEGWQADEEARRIARKYQLEKYFIHRTGHSIAPGNILHSMTVNLDNYETKDNRKILPRLGFSVEPGIYLPEFGVRSEINIYVNEENGPQITTTKQEKILTFS